MHTHTHAHTHTHIHTHTHTHTCIGEEHTYEQVEQRATNTLTGMNRWQAEGFREVSRRVRQGRAALHRDVYMGKKNVNTCSSEVHRDAYTDKKDINTCSSQVSRCVCVSGAGCGPPRCICAYRYTRYCNIAGLCSIERAQTGCPSIAYLGHEGCETETYMYACMLVTSKHACM